MIDEMCRTKFLLHGYNAPLIWIAISQVKLNNKCDGQICHRHESWPKTELIKLSKDICLFFENSFLSTNFEEFGQQNTTLQLLPFKDGRSKF